MIDKEKAKAIILALVRKQKEIHALKKKLALIDDTKPEAKPRPKVTRGFKNSISN